MTEPTYLRETRTSYDTVAVHYAPLVRASFGTDVFGRAMLAAFAELVLADSAVEGVAGPVADIGCGPGHVTAHLRSLGLDAFGIDLSPGMIDVARRNHPGVRFDVGSMTALDGLADGELGGLLAWYSFIHMPPEVLPTVFAGFHRVLAPGGHLLLGFHAGDERRRKTEGYGGHPMSLDVHLLPPARITALAADAGFTTHAELIEPLGIQGTPQARLLLRKASAG